ncbi:hypothetical protein KL86DPRO_11514 [uncultured delta proteobacterium]|uniref:Uncharacterized protein n=1 Tax=uncultured delta proteobacterium TaxID=34034 RepID=A0A212JI55_9DELT|nr:hypothetical protein KL86DPRO_11514 [uncultured delta proteobacterium]
MARRKTAAKEDAPLPAVGEALSDEDRVARLEEAVNRQLDYVLQNEVTDLAARIRDIKAAMDMIRAIKAGGAAKTGDASMSISFLE